MAIIVNKEEKRRAIALSCSELLLEYGISDLTISQIAKTAGVGKGTIYEYFTVKGVTVKEVTTITLSCSCYLTPLTSLTSFDFGDPVGFVDPLGLKTYTCKENGIGGHYYNCVWKNGKMTCQSLYPSQEVKAPDIYLPSFGLPATNDQYNPKICKEKDDDKNYCIENCLLKIWNSPRPDYALGPPGTDCQEYTEDTLNKCIEICKQ